VLSPTTPLSPASRAQALEQLAGDEFDVLVIGAGVTGAGAALDAATRGLKVGLVEARDYASGTSSRSTKLFHGGLRYLEQFDFRLVFEALQERKLALETLAPHLAKPVRFIYPLLRTGVDRAYAGLGIGVYDVMGAGRGVPSRLRHLGRRKTIELFGSGDPSVIRGSIAFYEGQVDDARHTMMLSRTAAHFGAAVASSTRVVGFLADQTGPASGVGGRISGVRVRDLESGREIEVRARTVINAAGVWIDQLAQMLSPTGLQPARSFRVRASKGVHLLVPRDRIDAGCGLITRTKSSLLFVIPWHQHWIIGTTDTDWDLDLAHPAASSADIDYLLGQVNRLLATPLSRDDVMGVYAGLRPLLAGESDSTSKLSREHAVATPVPGLITVAGGKYKTYRVMAADAVDVAVRELAGAVGGAAAAAAATPSVTAEVPLLGADGYRALWNTRSRLAAESGLSTDWVEHLLNRYGSLTAELFALIADRPELGRPLASAPGYLAVEALYAATHEGALHLDDILARRTRISIETWDRGVAAASEVAALVAPELGWDEAQVAREVAHYTTRVAAERESQDQPDDHSADAARLGAPDVRMDGRR
jgi:glycerol-3-phosphate dehydrogenase